MTRSNGTFARLHAACLPTVALAALCGSAQAHTSNVTVYGLVDACAVRADLGKDTLHALNSGCLYGSRLGFRGQEDLGGGWSAGFTLEGGLSLDNGQLAQGGRIFGRKALLALGGPWGRIEMGRDYAPAFYLVQPVDPMGLGIGTASSTLWTGSAATTVARNDNVVNLISPDWGGWSLRAQLAAGEGGTGGARKSRGLGLQYRHGGTLAGLTIARVANAADSADDRATTLAVKHDFGRFSLAAIGQWGAWEGSRTAAAPASTTALFSRKYRSWLLGGGVAVGAVGRLNLSWKRYDDRSARNYDATQWSLAYVHTLSKRTDLYAGGSWLDNRRGSAYGVADASTTYGGVTPGASTSMLAAGIKHVF